MNKDSIACIERLKSLGISHDDALALRRISMTLHRWHEMECGDSNDHSSWAIVRGNKPARQFYRDPETQAPMWRDGGDFQHDDNGKPYIKRHIHTENKARYSLIPDRENGAKKRLAKIMAQYPTLRSYIQGDPRGCALYILRNDDVPGGACHAVDQNMPIVDSYYSRGLPVHA